MYTRSLGNFLWQSFGLVVIIGLAFLLLSTFHLTAGHFIDWAIGAVSCWWLFVIVTVPWDVYFEARSVIDEADRSKAINIAIDTTQLTYAQRVARRALLIALGLHLASSATLFLLSYFHITPIGYIASAAALLLTGLRPAVRAYEYLWQRLQLIKHQFHYPREDVVELRARVQTLEAKCQYLENQLNLNEPSSYAAGVVRNAEELRQRLNNLTQAQQQNELSNQQQHEALRRDGQNAIAQISADTQFLDHVREIIRMIKSA